MLAEHFCQMKKLLLKLLGFKRNAGLHGDANIVDADENCDYIRFQAKAVPFQIADQVRKSQAVMSAVDDLQRFVLILQRIGDHFHESITQSIGIVREPEAVGIGDAVSEK